MFYSHEILTNRQYGVATIWLVATVGKGATNKKVTRKAIEAVDVQKACEKIIEPGAPVALRVQSQLLYGVSRVYNQQCDYLLSDLMKIQTDMHVFFTKHGGDSQTDPEAGQTRPENLLIMNDPDFVPDTALPKYDLDALLASSQQTNKTNSQMSPHDSTVLSGSRSPGSRSLESAFNVQLDLNRSDSSAPRRSPFGLQGLSSAQKPEGDELILPQAHDFAGAGDWGMDMDDDDDYAGAGDWGMEIDENGNITELGEPAIVQDEPDLPRLPSVERDNQAQANQEQQDQPIMDDQGDIVMMDTTRPEAQPKNQAPYEHDLSDDDARPAPSRPKRKPRAVLFDEVTQLSRSVIHDWQADYLKNCATKKARRTPAAVSKANAMLLTFGFGLSNVGRELSISGMTHPLVRQFSGDALFTALTGLDVPEQPHGTRRSASEPIEDGDEQDGRRVRPRVESDFDQQGRGIADDGVGQGAQTAHGSPEVGRDAQAAMSDNMSSALRMPWNRGSSLVPGSSIRGSAQKGRIPSSPPANRDNIQDPALFSDGASFGGDDFDFGMGGPPSDDSFGGLNLAPEPKPDAPAPEEGERPSVDIEGANFLSYVGSAARENGERRLDEDEDVDRRWVAFDDVFVPKETTRETAAQAFYNALSLVSKGKMNVQQDGDVNEPFGDITSPGRYYPPNTLYPTLLPINNDVSMSQCLSTGTDAGVGDLQ